MTCPIHKFTVESGAQSRKASSRGLDRRSREVKRGAASQVAERKGGGGIRSRRVWLPEIRKWKDRHKKKKGGEELKKKAIQWNRGRNYLQNTKGGGNG